MGAQLRVYKTTHLAPSGDQEDHEGDGAHRCQSRILKAQQRVNARPRPTREPDGRGAGTPPLRRRTLNVVEAPADGQRETIRTVRQFVVVAGRPWALPVRTTRMRSCTARACSWPELLAEGKEITAYFPTSVEKARGYFQFRELGHRRVAATSASPTARPTPRRSHDRRAHFCDALRPAAASNRAASTRSTSSTPTSFIDGDPGSVQRASSSAGGRRGRRRGRRVSRREPPTVYPLTTSSSPAPRQSSTRCCRATFRAVPSTPLSSVLPRPSMPRRQPRHEERYRQRRGAHHRLQSAVRNRARQAEITSEIMPRSSAAPTLRWPVRLQRPPRREALDVATSATALSPQLTAEEGHDRDRERPSGRVARVTGPVVDVEFPRRGRSPRSTTLLKTFDDRRSIGEHRMPDQGSRSHSTSATTASAPSRLQPDRRTRPRQQVRHRHRRPHHRCPSAMSCQGHVVNVTGDVPLNDRLLGESIEIKDRWDIHRQAPDFDSSSRRLRCSRPASRSSTCSPRTSRAAKIGLFGGAGVGKTVLIRR